MKKLIKILVLIFSAVTLGLMYCLLGFEATIKLFAAVIATLISAYVVILLYKM